ncbi:MAG: class I SAM-dependent methyltransferase [Bacteroidetes bacterium]|nr:class I SAM-dependent methyltransferase [Bacteroidota bacterium]
MILLSPQNWPDYALIDSGNFEKLERFGAYFLARPEPKALWNKSLSEQEWNRLVQTRFVTGAGFGKAGKEDSGTWQMVKKMPEQWQISYNGDGFGLRMRLGLTAFKHVGLFPEQAPNWEYVYQAVRRIGGAEEAPKILNLFAYTGGASLAARAAGGEVTHLDAVRQVVTWARENMEASKMEGIRWIVEDALKFVRRQVRRGALFQGIILDPPAYGHGPEGERWKLDECLFDLLQECNAVLAPHNSFVLLNLYANGYSAVLADTLARQAFGDSGTYSFGELMLEDQCTKKLPLSVFARVER